MRFICSLLGHVWDDNTYVGHAGDIIATLTCVRCKKSITKVISGKNLLEALLENERRTALRKKYGF